MCNFISQLHYLSFFFYYLQKSGALSQTFSAGVVLNNAASDFFKDLDNDPFKSVRSGGMFGGILIY